MYISGQHQRLYRAVRFCLLNRSGWSKEAGCVRTVATQMAARAAVAMRRARSVTGPLRRAHPASGATWNVQVVRGKMSSQCLWHACRALSAGLLLMLLGAAMAVIGYYADTLSVAEEVRGNSTVSVKDEARGFHLNNLSYAGPIVMGFGGFIVVAACVMTFEARDSAAKVTPARPQTIPRPLPRRGQCAPARLDTLGVYRLPHVLPLPHSLPLAPVRVRPHVHRTSGDKARNRARFGSAPDLRSGSGLATPSVTALRRPLRRYALSVDEPPHSAVSASAVESECGSQSSLALDLHASGACAGVTLRVRDNTRRRPLARQQRLNEDTIHPSGESAGHAANTRQLPRNNEQNETVGTTQLTVEQEARACSAPPITHSTPTSPVPAITPPISPKQDTNIIIEQPETESTDEPPPAE
ncbi:unnamed protein product [Danaus chrysippus]|uniref:(African queen) hypothetical protein n=1 Tax=Danaus chrysippus TaxID=151541 RepID=A0A8J2QES4_9NEOP|nr:unnamed protein product [Danaus chrysippus]